MLALITAQGNAQPGVIAMGQRPLPYRMRDLLTVHGIKIAIPPRSVGIGRV